MTFDEVDFLSVAASRHGVSSEPIAMGGKQHAGPGSAVLRRLMSYSMRLPGLVSVTHAAHSSSANIVTRQRRVRDSPEL